MTAHTGKLRHCDTGGVLTGAGGGRLQKDGVRQVNWISAPGEAAASAQIGPDGRRPSILEGLPRNPARRRDRRD
jgi:hypothetical protein